jgi:transcriptional regulator with XRE-family HTH domain
LTSDRAQWLIATDLERRLRLRAFLMHARSRLAPSNVGLPETGRRRVPGLRREEVAELAGISAEWYRLFESGRPISVSPSVLERIAIALGLDAFDQSTLFRLALPELYRAQIVALAEPPATMSSLVAPLRTLSDVEEVRRSLITEREYFFTSAPSEHEIPHGGGAVQILRPRILNSWRRSHDLKVEAGRSEARLEDQHTVDLALALTREQLMRVSDPILTHLADMLADIGYAIVLTDRRGTILDVRCDAGMRRRLDHIGFESGADWSEASTGTNAIGTALSDGRPLQLMAAEHYCDGWQDLTCTAAPIHDPQTGQVVGALDITGDYHLVRPQLLGTIVQYALEIEERLATASSAHGGER